MNSLTLRHGCKINFYLKIGRRLPNGYHEIDSLFLPLEEPHDLLEVRRGSDLEGGIRTGFFSPGNPLLPLSGIDPADNSLTRAHAWYARSTGFSPELDIRIIKSIPPGSGLGGGSANAAALLSFLQREAPKSGFRPLPREELLEASQCLGADVPFFLLGGAAHASGIGEKLRPAKNPLTGMHVVLLCPPVSVSTAWAYRALDERREATLRDGAASAAYDASSRNQRLTLEGHQATYSPPERSGAQGNDFEEIVFARYPQLAGLKEKLLGFGAKLVRMSGTGAGIFAAFRHEDAAAGAAKTLASGGVTVYMMRM